MKCPNCKSEYNIMDMLLDDDIRILFNLLPRFQGHSRLAFEYCELFGVAPIGKKTKKLSRLLAEVAALFEQQKFTFQKREYSISVAGIVEGLKIMCNKGFDRPLVNHNYLKQVLIGISDTERKGARDEADRAQRAREGLFPYTDSGREEKAQPEPDLAVGRAKTKEYVGKFLKTLEAKRELPAVDPEERKRELKAQAEKLRGNQ